MFMHCWNKDIQKKVLFEEREREFCLSVPNFTTPAIMK